MWPWLSIILEPICFTKEEQAFITVTIILTFVWILLPISVLLLQRGTERGGGHYLVDQNYRLICPVIDDNYMQFSAKKCQPCYRKENASSHKIWHYDTVEILQYTCSTVNWKRQTVGHFVYSFNIIVINLSSNVSIGYISTFWKE